MSFRNVVISTSNFSAFVFPTDHWAFYRLSVHLGAKLFFVKFTVQPNKHFIAMKAK